MDEATIATRIALGEDSVTELKSVAKSKFAVDASDFAKEIAALANTKGGQIFVGVEDDGVPTGIGDARQADALMLQIAQICADKIHPAIACVLRKVSFRGVVLLIVEVPPFSPDRPYRANRIYYVRDANRAREATKGELVRLLQSPDHHFDEQPVDGAAYEDLEQTAVVALLDRLYTAPGATRNTEAYLLALKCIDRNRVPTVAGVLLLGKEPQRWLPDARVTAVRFRGNVLGTDSADRQEIGGRLEDQLEAAAAFVTRHVPHPSHVEGMKRVEEGLPQAALREALANALAHRDYRAASQTQVFVFDDRVELINPGQLLNQLTIDSIRIGGITQRRNPVLSSLLARMGGRDNIRVGVPEMIRSMVERSLPAWASVSRVGGARAPRGP